MAEDEWARTERSVPVLDTDELAAAAAQSAAQKEREVGGPAWAGTLPRLDAHAPPQTAPVAPAAHVPLAPIENTAPVEDNAPTRYDLPAEAPRPLPPVPIPSDTPLMIAIGLIAAAIVLIVIGLAVALVVGF